MTKKYLSQKPNINDLNFILVNIWNLLYVLLELIVHLNEVDMYSNNMRNMIDNMIYKKVIKK